MDQNQIHLQGAAAMVFYFTLYFFFGWLLENIYSFLTREGFFKDNFLKGPFKLMYGFAPILLLLWITKETHWAFILFLCFFIPTLVEYVSGVMLKKVFNRQYWDYSNIPLQLHGHICLPFSICWVVLSFIYLQWTHPAVNSIYMTIQSYWSWIYPAVILYFTVELILVIKKYVFQSFTQKEPTSPI